MAFHIIINQDTVILNVHKVQDKVITEQDKVTLSLSG